MAKRTVVWTKTADILFAGTLEYWIKRNKSNSFSKKLVQLVAERTKHIANSPFIYRSTDFNNIRIASLGNNSILYKVTDEQIIVTAFWDNRQDPKKLLEILRNKK